MKAMSRNVPCECEAKGTNDAFLRLKLKLPTLECWLVK